MSSPHIFLNNFFLFHFNINFSQYLIIYQLFLCTFIDFIYIMMLQASLHRILDLLTLVSYDVGVKRYFDPSDTELLRALHSRNSKNIRNPLIFLQKMASYSCFWRVPSSKILLQASLHRIYDLLTLVSSYDTTRGFLSL